MMHRHRVSFFLILILLSSGGAVAQQSTDAWRDWRFLIGEWVGDGGGTAGQSVGAFSFAPDLGGAVLLRRSHADYPATPGKAAWRHEDLMIVSRAGEAFHAVYYDNEGHEIVYAAAVDTAAGRIVLTSEARAGAPRFRLTYTRTGEAEVGITFDIAPPGTPEAFSPYLGGRARRR